jgi:hypothetical protein
VGKERGLRGLNDTTRIVGMILIRENPPDPYKSAFHSRKLWIDHPKGPARDMVRAIGFPLAGKEPQSGSGEGNVDYGV